MSVSVVHNRRKGKKDAWFNEGKVRRGETAARGIQIATPKRIFWGRASSVSPNISLLVVIYGWFSLWERSQYSSPYYVVQMIADVISNSGSHRGRFDVILGLLYIPELTTTNN